MAFLISDDSSSTQEKEYDTSLSRKEIRELRLAFDMRETFPGSDEINAKKLMTVLRSLGHNPSSTEVQDMINEADPEVTGRIKFEPFLKAMENLMKHHKLDEELRDAFRVFDKDGDGTVPLDELRAVLRVAVDSIQEKELDEMLKDMDLNSDGLLDYTEFVTAMTV